MTKCNLGDLVVSFVIICLVSFCFRNIGRAGQIKSEEKIVSFKDGKALSGNFFLGIGSVDTNEYFYYYTDTEFGLQLKKAINDGCIFIQEDATPETARISYRYLSCKKTVHIPPNSISRDFKLDTE